jgi:hypothetical protein
MKPKQIPLRQYTSQEVEAFLMDDELDAQTAQIAKRCLVGNDHTAHSEQEKQAA